MTTSAELFERAQRVTPGGVHSPVRAFRSVGGSPVFFARGAGARLFDVDGRAYIDFCQSFGPLVLGHADADVARAVHEAVNDGWSFGACEPYSLRLAEWITARLPWVERVRFVSSGTEAVMSALRVARAATGRSRVLKFEGCYHGHTDSMLVQAGSGLAMGRVAASSAGVPDAILGDTLVAPLDDDEALDRIFETDGATIAAAIVEPLPANFGLLPQRAEWLARLADRCRTAGALLIFDEVISGFRVGLGGMTELLRASGAEAPRAVIDSPPEESESSSAAGRASGGGAPRAFNIEDNPAPDFLTPDLVTYGKVIGGGFPVAAYAGRAALMDLVAPVGPVYQAGTLSANPVGMRAGFATLSKMTAVDGWQVLNARTSAFCDALRAGFASIDPSIEVVSKASIFWIVKRDAGDSAPIARVDRIPTGQGSWFRTFFHAALQRGVYLPPSGFEVGFLSLAHDEATLAEARDALVEAAREACRP